MKEQSPWILTATAHGRRDQVPPGYWLGSTIKIGDKTYDTWINNAADEFVVQHTGETE